MKRIYFIERQNDIKSLTASDRTVCVAATEELARLARDAGFKSRWIGDYTTSAMEGLEADAWKMARSWHRSSAASILNYQGRNIGELVEFYFGLYIVYILKFLVQIREVLDQEGASEVYCFQEEGFRSSEYFFPVHFDLICGKLLKGIGIHPKFLTTTRSAEAGRSFVESVKDVLRRSVYVLYAAAVRPSGRGVKNKVLFCSALQHVDKVIEQAKASFAVDCLDEPCRLAKMWYCLRRGIPYFCHEEIRLQLSAEAKNRLKDWKKEVAQGSDRMIKELGKSGVFTWRGTDMTGVIAEPLRRFLENHASSVAEMVEAFSFFLSRNDYRVILLDEDTITYRKALSLCARQAGITTLQIPHGVNYAGVQYDLFPVSSEHVAVGGRLAKQYYMEHGVGEQRIHVTGVPRFGLEVGNGFSHSLARYRNDLQKRAAAANSKKIITLATTWFQPGADTVSSERDHERAVRGLAAALAAHPECYLVLKLHPIDLGQGKRTADILRECGVRSFHVVQHVPAPIVLSATDIMVSFHSNIVIESLLLGKATIVLDYFSRSDSNVPFFKDRGSVLCVQNDAALAALLDRYLLGDAQLLTVVREAQDWFRDAYCEYSGAEAARRIVDKMKEFSCLKRSGL